MPSSARRTLRSHPSQSISTFISTVWKCFRRFGCRRRVIRGSVQNSDTTSTMPM